MSPARFSAVFLLFASGLLAPGSLPAQQEAVVERIIDQFSGIEDRLASMQTLRIDASHADSDYGLGEVTIWIEEGRVAKVKNELFADETRSQQEAWLVNNQLIFFFERSEWHGNQDGTVHVNEYRYYLDQGQVIREMNRSAVRQPGAGLDISAEPHQISDRFDEELGRSLYDDKKRQTAEFIKTANALSTPTGTAPDLLNRPYRLMLSTLSPGGKYAAAWGIAGVSSPDWLRWERERYDYLTALGDPTFTVHLVDLASGAKIGEIEAEFEPGGSAPYFWMKWSDDGSYCVAGSDYRWATSSALLYRLENGALTKSADLAAATSSFAMDALRQADHPYAIDSTDAMGFIDLKRLAPDGTLELTFAIESKFEGPRRNASVDMQIKTSFATGNLSLLSSRVGDFAPFPTSWEKFRAIVAGSASRWMQSPPAVVDYLQLNTMIDDGVQHLYNLFGGFLNQDLVEVLIQRPIFTSSIHYPGGLVLDSRFEFSHYDPESIRAINARMNTWLTDEFVSASRDLYVAEFSAMAKHFQEALHYWQANPAELERQKAVYLNHLNNETLPEYYYLLDGDLANSLMEDYSEDWTQRTCYLTALRFWLRRSCDGSYGEFANLLQHVIAAYDPAYFAYRGLPGLKQEITMQPAGQPLSEVIMDEAGVLGVNHLTPFDQASLQAQLPGFNVEATDYYDEGGQSPAFKVSQGSNEILTLIRFDSGDPLAFEARSRQIRLKSGIATGDAFADVFRDQRPLGLFNGLETDIGAVMVEAPGSERITLLFLPPSGRTITDLNLKRDDLADFVLTEMRWMP